MTKRKFTHCTALAAALFFILLQPLTAGAQGRNCKDCHISSFQSATLYYVAQPHSTVGIGIEGGKWNKEDSRFSYFLGAKMQWFTLDPASEKYNSTANNMRFSLYVKGQVMLINRLYVTVTPQFVNLSSFEASLGLRYTYPLSEVVAVGIEPNYSFIQKEYALNVNLHFAL